MCFIGGSRLALRLFFSHNLFHGLVEPHYFSKLHFFKAKPLCLERLNDFLVLFSQPLNFFL